jgi:hypothetical protein
VYRKLDPSRIIETSRVLRSRVEERFPSSSLARVAGELFEVTQEAATLSAWLARPNYRLRGVVAAVIALLVGLLVTGVVQFRGDLGTRNFGELVQVLEAFVNDLVFVGVAIYFLWNVEVRGKRKRALEALHVLRSIAHIIDMHQLTKDPERLIARGLDTASSPERTMTPFELTRYLDYSSEMLAIISKVAALYVQELPDPVTVDAASAVEDLAGGLSRTIWQKIVILDRIMSPDPSPEPTPDSVAPSP